MTPGAWWSRGWRRLAVTGILCLMLTGLGRSPLAGQVHSTLVGTVSDSLTGEPLAGVAVLLEGTGLASVTDSTGEFRLVAVDGEHTLAFRRPGFKLRSFRITLGRENRGTLPIGEIVLESSPTLSAVVSGRVIDDTQSRPISSALVDVNGRVVALTGDDGRFEVTAHHASVGYNELSVRRIGFRRMSTVFWVTEEERAFDFAVTLDNVPYELEEIVVEADRMLLVPPRMAEFYRRRAVGIGHFFTPDDIERIRPYQTSSLLRRVPGVDIRSDPNDPFNKVVRIGRAGGLCGGVQIYIDGIPMAPGSGLDWIARPERLAGVEVFTGPAEIPVQYNRTGSACGVVLLWTK